jgi:hypothetical protein
VKSWTAHVALFLSIYAVALVVFMPAQQAARLFQRIEPRLALTGVSGSLARGAAANARWGSTAIGGVGWRHRPAAMLRACLAFGVEVDAGGGLRGIWEYCPGRGQAMRDLGGTIPAVTLNHWNLVPAHLTVAGEIGVHGLTLAFDGDTLEGEGRGIWKDAALEWGSSARLGSLAMRITIADGVATIGFADPDAPARLEGRVSVQADGVYRIEASMSAAFVARAGLDDALATLGARRQGGGGYRLAFSGALGRGLPHAPGGMGVTGDPESPR